MLLIAAATLAGCLVLLLAADFLLQRKVLERLREIDPEARISGVRFGTDCLIAEGVRMPGLGARLEVVTVLLEGPLLQPRPQIVCVQGGLLRPNRIEDGRRDSQGSEGAAPRVCFQDLILLNGSDSSRCSGMVAAGGTELLAGLEGDWGSAVLRLRRFPEGESLLICTEGLQRLPFTESSLPIQLQGRSYDSRLSGSRNGRSLNLRGSITAIDGERVDVPVFLSADGSEVSARLTLRLETFGDWLEARTSTLGAEYVSISPYGEAEILLSADSTVCFSCSARVAPVSIFDPELCSDTLHLELAVNCRGRYDPVRGQLSVESGSLVIGEAGVLFDMEYLPRPGPRLRISLWSDSLGGRELSSSVPPPLLGRLQGLALGGSVSFRVDCVLDWAEPDSCDFVAEVNASGLRVEWSPVRFGRLRGTGARCRMEDSWGNFRTIALDTLNNNGFLSFDRLPASWEPLLLCAEDATFRRHSGFSLYHIRNSIVADVESGSFRRGGSTITMQLAKNLFLGREKVLARKIQEVFLTWRLESYLSKDRMLEIYANIVEMGPDVFGVGEAALYFFDQPAESLSVLETAYLVSILPGPRLYHGFFVRNRVPDYWRAYLERLVAIAVRKGWLPQSAMEEARSDSLVFRRARWSGSNRRSAMEEDITRETYERRLERSLYRGSVNVDSP